MVHLHQGRVRDDEPLGFSRQGAPGTGPDV
jgi:hypothetical protein